MKAKHPIPITLAAGFLVLTVVNLLHGGGFIPTGSMNVRRSGHTATLLPNGQVLVTGGAYPIFQSRASAELYDPVTRTWSLTTPMAVARHGHTATLLPDGKVLVAGGVEGGSWETLRSAELYDPATATWSATGSLSTNRWGHTATLLLNGMILVAGGRSEYIGEVQASAELYDPVSGTWTPTDPISAEHQDHPATLLSDGRVLVVGYSMAELYDPNTETWSNTRPMNWNHYGHTATLLPDGRVLIAGGEYVAPELYDPVMDTWTDAITNSTYLLHHTATALPNGMVLISGGMWDHRDGPGRACAALYDPTERTLTIPPAVLNRRRMGHTSTLLANGQVLLAGGDDGAPTAELYDDSIPSQIILSPPSIQEDGAVSISFTAGALPFEPDWPQVLVTTNLALPTNMWEVHSASLPAPVACCCFVFKDHEATNSTQRFYRVRLAPRW